MEAKRAMGEAIGSKLRQAREERRLSISDVGQALRLSTRIVSALEEDAYELLPGPTYVRGYLRNYAQFLGLSPQQLVDAYNSLPQASKRTEMTARTPVRQVTSSDMLVRLGTVVVAVIVFGLAALWWSGHDVATVTSRTPQGVAPQQPVTNSVPATAPAPVAADAEQPTESASLQPETSKTIDETTKPDSASAQPPSAATATPAASAPQDVQSTATATPSTPSPKGPLARLVLYVHEDSWADVRDAQEHRLLYETIPAGRVVTVEGTAPLSVFLGNVAGVTVEFNGELYDAMRYKRGQVARFTLGSPQG